MRKFKRKSIPAFAMSLTLLMQLVPAIPASAEVLTNDRYVYEFLTGELGLPHASASGLMANIDQECAFVPTASCVDTNGLVSYGLMQWNGPRFEQLKSFCETYGYGYDTLEGQLAFLEYDLTGVYSGYYNYLLYDIEHSEQGAYDAAYFWAERYEVCSSSYFEVRAELAQNYYYPAYMEYAPAAIVVFEDIFYASLCGTEKGMALTDDGKTLKMQRNTGSSNQTWEFIRQDAAYRIVNCGTGRVLNLSQNPDAMWYFYETASGYMLELAGTEEVLGCASDNTLQMQISGGSERQSFQLAAVQPAAAAKLKVQYEAAPSVTEFSWEAAEHADSYRLKIYSGSEASGTPCVTGDKLKDLKYEAALSAGTYTAVLESINECGAFAGEPVVFAIGQQEPVDLGETFYAKISWNSNLQYLTHADAEETAAQAASENAEEIKTGTEVLSESPSYGENQLWRFVRSKDGSYRIYAYDPAQSLSVEENKTLVLAEKPDTGKDWMIYGDPEKGYVLQPAEAKTEVLSAALYSKFETAAYAEKDWQHFEIADYAVIQPTMKADASGGVREPVHFTWDAVDCVNGYLLEVKNEKGLVAATLQIRDNKTEADIVLREGNYTAVVTATSSVTGETVSSESVSVSVKNLPERPTAGIDISETAGTVSVFWNRCEDANTYSYKIEETVTGETVVQKESVKGFGDEIVLETGRYLLTVAARNSEGSVESGKTALVVRENSKGEPEVSLRSILASKKKCMIQEREGGILSE